MKIEYASFLVGPATPSSIVSGVVSLLKHLSRKPIDEKVVEKRAADFFNRYRPEYTLIIAQDEKLSVIGMAILITLGKLSGKVGLVEDVVVDPRFRGGGVGSKLMKKIILCAVFNGLKHIDLTSGDDRIAANHLYRKLGFKRRKTNVYRLAVKAR